MKLFSVTVVSLLHCTTSCSHITTLWILVLSGVAMMSCLFSSCWLLISMNLLNNKGSHCFCLSSAEQFTSDAHPL